MMGSNSIPSNNTNRRRNIFPHSDSRSHRSASSHHSTSSSSKETTSAVSLDEAFRRVGHRLSQRVGGVRDTPRPVANLLAGQATSAFSAPRRESQDAASPGVEDTVMSPATSVANSTSSPHDGEVFDRSPKVAKTRYTDHGNHQRPPDPVHESILKRLTQRAQDTYEKARQTPQDPHKEPKKHVPPSNSSRNGGFEGTAMSPHRQALSQLALDDGTSSTMSMEPDPIIRKDPQSTVDSSHKGLLEAALEQQDPSGDQRKPGKCLTLPEKPMSNDGLDNSDGNLIVHQGDHIEVPPDQVTNTIHGGPETRSKFVVIEPLGQGTFAQVFKCRCVATGDLVAVKIVKNKPAYTRQAAVEIDVFRVLRESNLMEKNHMVRLMCHFVYKSHLCLVFELLGLNLYEVLKKRQFRGLPLAIVRNIIQQAIEGIKDLSQKSIVHCDIKPENILLCSDEDVEAIVTEGERPKLAMANDAADLVSGGKSGTPSTEDTGQTSASDVSSHSYERIIKLIDFGSACFEGHTAHTYIQSRFYRSPEVLIGLPYDSAIDMWSLGCVTAELFLGLPILPGVHEHDQLGRISEMIGTFPDWMIEQGSKSSKYFLKELSRTSDPKKPSQNIDMLHRESPPPPQVSWRLRTLHEYIQSLSAHELRKKGGVAKLEKQPTNRYFKRKRLADIIMLHGQASPNTSSEELGLFVHFLLGILHPDPWKRWTAYQASMHPFITGGSSHRRRMGAGSVATGREVGSTEAHDYDIYWVPPWDPSICKRKLLNVQKTREKQQAMRRSSRSSIGSQSQGIPGRSSRGAQPNSSDLATSRRSRVAHMRDDAILRRQTSLPTVPQRQQTIISSGAMHNSVFHLSQQGMTGDQGISATPSGGMLFDGMQHPQYVAFSGPGYQPPMMANPSGLPGAHSGYRELPMTQPMQFVSGPQSLTAFSYGGHGHMPVEGDLGYALQRPGVVPGMSGDLSGSLTMNQPVQVGAVGGYSPHQFASHMGGHGSFTGQPGSHGAHRRHTHSYSGGIPASYEYSGGPPSASQSMHVPSGFMTSPTSIQEDATNFNLGGLHSDQPRMLSSSLQTSSQGSSASLLALQLEGRSGTQTSHQGSIQDMTQQGMDDNGGQAGLPQYIGPGATAFSHSGGLPAGTYYTTYFQTAGAGMMSAPAAVTGIPQHVGYGGYVQQPGPYLSGAAPPSSLEYPAYPPSALGPSSEEARRATEQSASRAVPRPPFYQGTSM